ncbi:MAG: oligosaccharide flippase family protein [Candidatus Krumholzibacteria bacterium]|nr:oligosaccharide flippase family protein [Candidatus Krumholzibacteria bacterium]
MERTPIDERAPSSAGSAAPGRGAAPVDLTTAKVISETFFVSASKIGISLLKPVRSVILGRLLQPALYGVLSIPSTYVQLIVIFCNIGFNTAVAKLIPEYRQRGREDLAAMIYRAAAFLTVALGALWCVLLILLAPWIARDVAHLSEATLPIRVYALVIPFLALDAFYAVVFLTVQRGKARALITLIHGLFNVTLPIAAVLWRRDVTLVIGGFLTSEVIGALCYTAWFHGRAMRGWMRGAGPLLRGIREVFGFGYLFFFAGLGWNLINSVDRIMVKYYLPADELGFYAMASIVITVISIVPATAGTALIPSLSAARVSGDRGLFRRQIVSTSHIALAVMVPVTAMIFMGAGDLFAVALPRFSPSVPLMRMLVLIGVIDILCRIAWASLVAHGRGGLAAVAYVAAALINAALNRLLIPRIGTTGAAAATLATFGLLAAALQAMMWSISRVRIRPSSLLHPALLCSVFPLLAMAAGGLPHWARLAVILVPGGAAYLLLALLTGLIRSGEISAARRALAPRAHVPHVRAALAALVFMERIARNAGK